MIRNPDERDDRDERVECPACAELIRARAKLCRFCGHELAPVPGKRRERGRLTQEAVARAEALASTALILSALSGLLVGMGCVVVAVHWHPLPGMLAFVAGGLLAPVSVGQGTRAANIARAARKVPPGSSSAARGIGIAVLVAWAAVLALVVIRAR